MSFFLASVAEGTQLYHGRGSNESVTGPEWLAFEPEHAMMFARPLVRPKHHADDSARARSSRIAGDLFDPTEENRHAPVSTQPKSWKPLPLLWEAVHYERRPKYFDAAESDLWHERHKSTKDIQEEHYRPSGRHHDQLKQGWLVPTVTSRAGLDNRLFEPGPLIQSRSEALAESIAGPQGRQQKPIQLEEDKEDRGGFLHTYRTKHPLSLLYIDGMSAGKTFNGTLDSTDYILQPLNSSVHNPMMGEWARAYGLCNLSNTEWEGRIDGFLRMEMGFEIILCDFEKHLDVEFISRTSARDDLRGGFGTDMSYYRAVASRFDGIGGDRVRIDYNHFVTGFAYGIDLFEDNAEHPRIANVSNITRTAIRDDIATMIISNAPVAAKWEKEVTEGDWQSVADMIVTRYSDRLAYLSSRSINSLDQLQAETEALLAPYIDFGHRNHRLEVERCALQYLPTSSSSPPQSVAANAIYTVTKTLCNALVNTTHASSLKAAQTSVQTLIDYLRWTSWKRCRNCELDEVCFIPIWPLGRKQDYEQPACQRSIPRIRNDSYWGGFGGPGRRRRGRESQDVSWRKSDHAYPAEDHRTLEIFEGSSYREIVDEAWPEERDNFLE
ncbi:MAG: hypothetical protein Q9165_001753 [Trypethelium subeluteriae]